MFSLLQLSTKYFNEDEEIALPAETADGDVTLNQVQVFIIQCCFKYHAKQVQITRYINYFAPIRLPAVNVTVVFYPIVLLSDCAAVVFQCCNEVACCC